MSGEASNIIDQHLEGQGIMGNRHASSALAMLRAHLCCHRIWEALQHGAASDSMMASLCGQDEQGGSQYGTPHGSRHACASRGSRHGGAKERGRWLYREAIGTALWAYSVLFSDTKSAPSEKTRWLCTSILPLAASTSR